jgi:hypothetical protein
MRLKNFRVAKTFYLGHEFKRATEFKKVEVM